MTKQVKAAFWVVGIALVGYFLFNSMKTKKQEGLSDQEKNDLFNTASGGLRGGAAPPPDIMDQIIQQEQAALLKIEQLGLMAEYEAYKKANQNAPDRP